MKHGCTRSVLLIGRWAIKFPTCLGEPRHFIKGMLDNIEEATIASNITANITQVFYCNFLGLVLIAERVRPVRNYSLYHLSLAELCAKQPENSEFYKHDAKPDNFGYDCKNNFIKLDYAYL